MTIGLLFSSGNDATMRKPCSIVRKLIGNAHPHVAVDKCRCPLGVKRNEIEWRAGLASGVVGAAQAMFKKCSRELRRRRRPNRGRQLARLVMRAARRR